MQQSHPAKKTFDLLQSYMPTTPEEKVYQQKMLELLQACDDCFLRSCRVGHFTASAFLLNHKKTHALMLHHRKVGNWFQPGGHCDGDPDVLAVAIKEAQEESGIEEIRPLNPHVFDIDIHLFPTYKDEQAHYHYDVRFVLHAYGDDTLHQNHESKALEWIDVQATKIPNEDPSVKRLFTKWQAQLAAASPNAVFSL